MDSKIEKSLRYSIVDGAFYFLMVGCGETFIIPFAIFLNADNFQLGMLGTLPLFIGSLSQLFSSRVMLALKSRKWTVCIGGLVQGLTFLPMVIVALNSSGPRVEMLIVLTCFYFTAGMIITPAWSSWMGDMVPENFRGRYFSHRNRILGLMSVASLLVAGGFMHLLQDQPETRYLGFTGLFFSAMLFRIVSFIFLSLKWEPPFDFQTAGRAGLLSVFRDSGLRNFRALAAFLALMNFGVYMSAPFFAPYMFKELKINFITFTFLQGTIILAKYFSLPSWGKVSDKFGSRKVLILNSFLLPFLPLVWLLSRDIGFLVLAQVIAGWVWSGFELASFNFILDNTRSDNRAQCIAFFNLLNGVAVLLGGALGTQAVLHFSLMGSPYLFVFLLSGLTRMGAVAMFHSRLREIRPVRPISFQALIFRPFIILTPRLLLHYLEQYRNKKL